MKKLFRKILVPLQLDGAPPEEELRIARELAKRDTAEVILLHIVPMLPSGDTPLPIEYYQRQETEARRALDKLARRSFSRFKTECLVITGDPAESLLSEARRLGVSAIVMATHGRRGLKHLLLGSVAERVVREAHCPVITVPPDLPSKPPSR